MDHVGEGGCEDVVEGGGSWAGGLLEGWGGGGGGGSGGGGGGHCLRGQLNERQRNDE